MIPTTLTLKGIYSYQDKEQIINFNHLTDAGIFGIFGLVGSGKSTILEAISYALYGETERLNKRENRGYNMMNLKSANLFIDFVFKGGKNNDEYRFVVKGRRNSKNFSDVKAFDRTAYKKQNNKWIPISADSTEEIIGLNYLNFRRTVIIPQGKFQEFLQLGDSERTKMMKELFNLGKFDLSFKVRTLELENDEKLSILEGQLIQLIDVSQEIFEETNVHIKKLGVQIEQNKLELEGVQKKSETLRKIQILFEQINILNEQYDNHNKQKEKFELLENELNEYNYCIHHFKLLVENKDKIEIRNRNLKKELESLSTKYTELKKQNTNGKEKLKQLKPGFDNREKLKIQAEELEKLQEVKETTEKIKELSARMQNGEAILKVTTNEIEALSKNKIVLQGNIKNIKNKIPDLSILSSLKEWYTNYRHMQEQLIALEKEKHDNILVIQGYEKDLKKVTSENLSRQEFVDVELIIKAIKKADSEIEGKLLKIDKELQHYQLRESLTEYAQNLHENEACPVCGSTSHPDKLKEKDISGKIKLLNKQKQALKVEKQSLSKLEKAVNEISFKIKSLKELIGKQEQKSIEIKQTTKLHLSEYPVKEKVEEAEIDKQFRLAKSLQEELKINEKKLYELETTYEKELLNKEKYTKALNQFKSDLISANTKKTTLSTQIKHVDKEKWLLSTDYNIADQINTLQRRYSQITVEFENLNNRLNSLVTELGKYEGIIQTKEKDLKLSIQEFKIVSGKLNKSIEKSDFRTEEQIKNILKKEMDIKKTSSDIEAFKQKLFSLKEQLDNLQLQAKDKEYDAAKYEKISRKLTELKSHIEKLGKELGSFEKERKTLKNKLLVKQKLESRQKEHKLRAENIATLKSF